MFRFPKVILMTLCIVLMVSVMFAGKKVSTKETPKNKVNTPEVVKPVETPKVPAEDILIEHKGGIITKKDLEDKISKLPAQAQSRYKTVDGQVQILDMIAVEEVFYQKAKDLNLLNAPGVTDKINAAKKQFYIQEYYKRNVSEMVILTEADKQDYYRNNLKDFYVDPYLTILYIQPKDEAMAKKAMDELKRGEPFDSVSARYSINTYAKGLGGKIKNIRHNGYIPGVGQDAPLDSLIFHSKADSTKLLGPQQTATGWSIIKVMDKVDGKQRPYLECEAEVDQRMRPMKENDLLNDLTAKLKLNFKVVVDTTTLNKVNLREPAANSAIEKSSVVTSVAPELTLTVADILAKFTKLSPQEQMLYIKGGGATNMAEQEINRTLMYLDAAKNPVYDELMRKNEEFKQTERYYVLQEVYKQQVLDQLVVSSEDSRKYYDTHQDAYTTPASRKILTMWCKDEKTAKKALKQFTKAFNKKNQKALQAVITKYSVKPERDTLENQYQNGVVTGVGPDKNFSDLIWNTPIGKISPIILSAKNDVVFFAVLEEKPATVKSFTEVEPRIMGMIKKDKEKTKMEEVKQALFTEYGMKKFPEKITMKLSAEELFSMADDSARQRKFKDATIYYDQIIQFYPNGKDDYKAAFMKAFLISEEMANKEQGLQLFKDFLKKYPAGELNESAQFMIDELEGKNQNLEENLQDSEEK